MNKAFFEQLQMPKPSLVVDVSEYPSPPDHGGEGKFMVLHGADPFRSPSPVHRKTHSGPHVPLPTCDSFVLDRTSSMRGVSGGVSAGVPGPKLSEMLLGGGSSFCGTAVDSTSTTPIETTMMDDEDDESLRQQQQVHQSMPEHKSGASSCRNGRPDRMSPPRSSSIIPTPPPRSTHGDDVWSLAVQENACAGSPIPTTLAVVGSCTRKISVPSSAGLFLDDEDETPALYFRDDEER